MEAAALRRVGHCVDRPVRHARRPDGARAGWRLPVGRRAAMRRFGPAIGALATCALLAGCGGHTATVDPSAVPTATSLARLHIPAGDWTRFNYDAGRSGRGPAPARRRP